MAETHDTGHVSWEVARDANRRNWNDRAALHVEAYGAERFVTDSAYRSGVVLDDLPVLQRFLPGRSLAGVDLVHLQCHIGTDSISLAREGATVTGLDFSEASVAVATDLAARSNSRARFVRSDVLEVAAAVGERVADVVYTSIGTICWLNDLEAWAAQIAAILRPGGIFFIRDAHPMMLSLDPESDELVLRGDRYFNDGRADRWDDDSTYIGDGWVENSVTYEWPHPISEIIGVLLGAGLRLELFAEGKTLPWQFSSRMVPAANDSFAWPEADRDRVPCTFTIVARKPEAA